MYTYPVSASHVRRVHTPTYIFPIFSHTSQDMLFDEEKNNTIPVLIAKTILETFDNWDTDYNSDSWEPDFVTIIVTWQLRVTVDSIRNSCNVFLLWIRKSWCTIFVFFQRPENPAAPFLFYFMDHKIMLIALSLHCNKIREWDTSYISFSNNDDVLLLRGILP